MFEGLFQPMHLMVIFGLALLVFGPKKLPELGKGIGESIRGFKSAMRADDDKPLNTTTAVVHRLASRRGNMSVSLKPAEPGTRRMVREGRLP
jgi:sec-independent protein translocase protein TatA